MQRLSDMLAQDFKGFQFQVVDELPNITIRLANKKIYDEPQRIHQSVSPKIRWLGGGYLGANG